MPASSDLRRLRAKGLGALDLARLLCNGCMDHRDPAAVLMAARDVLETAGPGYAPLPAPQAARRLS